MKNLIKKLRVGSCNKASNLFTALLLAATILVAMSCAGEDDSIAGAGNDPKTPFDPKQSYPITVTVAKGSFQEGGEYVIAPFTDAAPTVAASVNSAKHGTKVTINISNVPEGLMLDGLSTVVKAEDGSRPALDKTNKFTMPSGPATVEVVFMSVGDFLKSTVAYDRNLYTLDIEKGELDTPAPNHGEPYRTAYASGDSSTSPLYWGASVAASGYSANDRDVTQIEVIGNNSGAGTSWKYKNDNHSLQTVGAGDSSYQAFYVEATVSPQVLSLFENLSEIPLDLQVLKLIDDDTKTVAQAYNEAKIAGSKSYYFQIRLREPAVNAFLSALNISTITKDFELSPALTADEFWGDANHPWANTYSTVTLNADAQFETVDPAMMEFNVTAEADDGNAMVKIGSQSYKAGANENSIAYDGLNDTSVTFDISVQAENDTCTKVYTIIIAKAAPKYASDVTGGSKYFIEEDGKAYEVHAFYIGSKDTVAAGGQKEAELNFGDEDNIPAVAEILIVAGGGAGGGAGGMGGGGGGGVIHYSAIDLKNVGTKTGSSNLIYPVKIGAGGAISTTSGQVSQNGGASIFGEGATRLEAPGGGGGGAFPTGAGRAFKGANGGNGGGGGTGANWYADLLGWGPHDNLNGTSLTDGNGKTADLGRAEVTPFNYSKNNDGSSIQEQLPDNIKTYPATVNTVNFSGDITQELGYQQSQSGNVSLYKVQHAGHAFGNRGGWAEGIQNSSGGSGAGTDAWKWTHYGRNSGDTGGQGIMFNTSGQWRWYSMGGPGGWRTSQPFSGAWNVAGPSQTGNGGAAGFAGGSGTVIVRWEIPKI
ncbi:hypothetical protein FACS1894102_3620 [Spirochaetia bacterium]|nr:hypothetical protein FACS1894102_3620 [Spirochaetia bacterium]